MGVSVLLDLLTQLVAQCDAALSAVQVYDGVGISEDPGDFLMIGVDDPDSDGMADSGRARQSPGPMGTNRPRDEFGTVTCAALSWNGDGDLAAARAGVKATTTAVENLLRTSPNLSGAVTGLLWTGYGEQARVIQAQDDHGAMAMLIFDIAFRARI